MLILVEMLSVLSPWPMNWLFGLLFAPIRKFFIRDLQPVFQMLEDGLSEEKPWFGGDKMGVSDFNMSWGMGVAVVRGYCDLDKFDKLKAWYKRISSREAKTKAEELSGVKMDLMYFGWKGDPIKF